ncbi:MAG: hypothetical protein IJ715_00320 [Bacilli bacterium]|nr:hypothetical protein [Bacilli bacterium]
MTINEEYRLYLGAYYGVQAMDSYELKVYILKEIDDYIKNFLKMNSIDNIEEEITYVKDNVDLKTKLQDSLILLNKINAPMELILLIKKRLKELN